MSTIMNDKINNSRKNFEKLGTVYSKNENVIISKETIENVNCYWFNSKKSTNSNKLVVYLHGGCFVLGSILSHQALVSHLSENLQMPVLFIEYSLAPEHPFPAALNEVFSVYNRLLLKYSEKDIIFMGDSAGAGLALSALSKINNEGMKAPAYLVMLSPWIDLTCISESITTNAPSDPILSKSTLQNFASMYVDKNLSEANPIENISGPFPPTLIMVGSGEVLLDDSKNLYNKIVCEKPNVKLGIYEKQNHVWMLENIHTDASGKALREISEFITD